MVLSATDILNIYQNKNENQAMRLGVQSKVVKKIPNGAKTMLY